MLSFSFAISAAVAGAAAAVCGAVVVGGGATAVCGVVVVRGGGAVVVAGGGTGAGGLGGGSCGDTDGIVDAPEITHHSTSANTAAAITLIKARSMVVSKVPPVIEVMRKLEVSMSKTTGYRPRMIGWSPCADTSHNATRGARSMTC